MIHRPTFAFDGQILAMPALEVNRPLDKPEFTEERELSHETMLSPKAVKGVEIAQ
jgi:hypothetical protein